MLEILDEKLEKGILSEFLKEFTKEELSKIAINIRSDLKSKNYKIILGIILYAIDNYDNVINKTLVIK